MNAIRFCLALGAILATGCTTPAVSYVSQHPELTPAQREIFTSGEIPAGDAVAGLTHEQVRLAMKGYPETFDKLDGQEAWVYVKKKKGTPSQQPASGTTGGRTDLRENAKPPEPNATVRTTVLFQGDRASRALVVREAQ
jgi:hypothetical protein